MAQTKFRVEVLTPEGKSFDDEVEMVSTRTQVGSIGILANHQPLLGMLEPGELRLYRTESDVLHFAQGSGFVQVSNSHVLILADELFSPDQLDVGQLEERLRRAEEALANAEAGSEQERVAKRDRLRYTRYLRTARGK